MRYKSFSESRYVQIFGFAGVSNVQVLQWHHPANLCRTLSPDGKSHTFDASANGYGRGEGIATLIIKRLSDAIAAGDPIRAIIRESSLNQDGKTETMTAPSQDAQVAVMRDSYLRAGLDPKDTQYFEAHGTGTATGDPIECRAIAKVFKSSRRPGDYLPIGSIKSNVGHTEAVSGLASLIKVVLALENAKIPPSINFESPNPSLDLEDWRLRVVTNLEDWPLGSGGVRRASINNFGFGGTNAHLIVEGLAPSRSLRDAHREIPTATYLDSQLLVFSARDEQACREMVVNFKSYLERKASSDIIEDVIQHAAHTLDQRRTRFPWVAALQIPVQRGAKEVAQALESQGRPPCRTTKVPRIGMVFTGQGAQWHGMGRELIAAYPLFKSSLKEIDHHLKKLGATWSVIEELSRDKETSRIDSPELSTPLCVAVQISLVRLLQSWGIQPVAVTSHSSGEIAAAYSSGALSCQSAMGVAYHRSLMAADAHLAGPRCGAMIALGLGVLGASSFLSKLDPRSGSANVACVNSQFSTTVSGDEKAVSDLEIMAKEDGIFARRLQVRTAFHSHHMKPLAEPYGTALKDLGLFSQDDGSADITFSSPVTGGRIKLQTLCTPKHWVDSLVHPVQFQDAFTDMVLGTSGPSVPAVDVIIEVGPHTALGGPIKQMLDQPRFENLSIPYFGCLVRGTSALQSMHSLAADLLLQGLPVNLDAINFPYGRPSSVRVLSDLPSYPWNHKTRHWQESRFNKALRTRSQPPHDLLGSLSLGTDLNNPSWRQILRLNDTPWLREHVLQKSVLYPGAGFICLAIEAIRQRANLNSVKGPAAAGYKLRDVDILQTLVVTGSADGPEIQTTLRQVSDKEIGSQGWHRFEVFSVSSDNEWTLHARGLITTELEHAPDKTIPSPRPAPLTGYTRRFQPQDLYAMMWSWGMQHGASYQTIDKIKQSGNYHRADSSLFVPDTLLPGEPPSDLLIHPITLDAVLQTIYTPLLGGRAGEDGKVPRSFGSLWISSAINNTAGHHFEAFTTLRHAGSRTLCADVTMADNDTKTTPPVLEVRNAVYQSLGRGAALERVDRQWENEPCMNLAWGPDISMLSSSSREHLQRRLCYPADAEETRVLTDLRRVCLYYISDALCSLTSDDIQKFQSHHAKFYNWMQHQSHLDSDGRLSPDSGCWIEEPSDQREALIKEVRHASVNGEMVCHLGPHLPAILRNEKVPIELMMEGNLLNKYYRNALRCERSFIQAANIFQHLIHKNPSARILEIGGGTGGMTRHALQKIGTSQAGGPLASLYHFTDISTAFFKSAREEFAEWEDIMLFDKLDIEIDPVSQDFDAGAYDIVIAGQVLHATRSISRTMAHVRRLLKPGGTLLMIETTQDQIDGQFVFGLLPGWWLSEEPERALSPTLTLPFLDRMLQANGFSGVEFDVRDCEREDQYMMNAITATAGPSPSSIIARTPAMVLVVRQQEACQPTWLDALCSSLSFGGQYPSILEFETATPDAYEDKLVVFLGELEQSLMYGLDSQGLSRLQTMMKRSRGVLWVTHGGAVDCESPEASLGIGLLRSIRHEYVERKYVTLDLDPGDELWSETSLAAITQTFTKCFNATGSPPYDVEYAERDGVIMVPRLFRDSKRNQALSPKEVDWTCPEVLPTEPFFQSNRSLSLKVGVPGLLNTLVFDDDPTMPIESSRLPPDMLEIEPRAFGVNFRDVMVAMGQLDVPVMGVESAGVITRVGSRAAAHGYAAGDEVFTVAPVGYGSRARVEWTYAMHIPPGLSFEQAASIPAVFTTVYLCLYKIARLSRGQTILIHAGAGGVGQAAIQFAKLLGAEVYSTVGSQEKRELLMNRYGIPDDHIYSSRDTSFAAGVRKATDGRGVDVVLNSLAGPLLQESFNILAPFGHFVEIGKRDLEENNYLEMRPFSRHVTFSSFDLLALSKHDGRLVHSALAEVGRFFEEGSISPVYPLTTYPLGDIGKALRLLQSGKQPGKIVLSASPQEEVRVLPRARTAHLRRDASYLLLGGAGGIGRSMSHWLAAHGARNLILLSRGAATSPAAADLVSELMPFGCRVKLVSCDASSQSELATALESSLVDFPPIRGVIQGAMVLQDSIFERMTFDDYQAAVDPKVKVSWNLHNQLRNADLDFFIFLSSMSGLCGYTTQSNYSAGNAYEDALAHWRVSQGLPAVSLNLGPVKSVGYVADTSEIVERMKKLGHYHVTEEHLLGALESAVLAPFDKQVALGINQGPGPHWHPESTLSLGKDARFQALQYRKSTQRHSTEGNSSTGLSLGSRLCNAKTPEEAGEYVVEAIISKLADIFMIPAAHIDPTKHLSDYGLDSLGAVELRNMLALQAATDVSIFGIMQSESIAALASEVTRKSTHVDSSLFLTNGFH